MATTIRNARLNDFRFLCGAFAQCNVLHRGLRPDLYRDVKVVAPYRMYFPLVGGQRVPGLRSLIQNRYCLKIAERNGEGMGAVFAQSEGDAAYLDNVVVLEGQRRQGIGTELVQSALDWAKAAGHKRVYGKILNKNTTSGAFFTAAGFVPYSVVLGKHLFADTQDSGQDADDSVLLGNIVVRSERRSSLSWSAFPEEAFVYIPDGADVDPGDIAAAETGAIQTGHTHIRTEISTRNDRAVRRIEDAGFTVDSTNVEIYL